jgi:copper oxidase (laccase) domain-containing protein
MLQSEVLITQEKNLALMLLTADCIPAIFYDPVQKIIALAHLNRKTIAHDLAQKTVDFLRERFKTNPADLLVHFGPHIKKESYYFPIPLAEKPKTQMAPFIEERDSIAYIDLTSAFLHQLEVSGVTKDHVTISDIDTGKSDQHFSHVRTQRNLQYPLGRLATIAMLHS